MQRNFLKRKRSCFTTLLQNYYIYASAPHMRYKMPWYSYVQGSSNQTNMNTRNLPVYCSALGAVKNLHLHDDNPQCRVDASYVVDPDMKSHIDTDMTIGKCATYTSSCKEKLYMKSPTEQNCWNL